MRSALKTRVSSYLSDFPHVDSEVLINILSGKTSISSTGYPYISESSFAAFLNEVPHLFEAGDSLLQWLDQAEQQTEQVKNLSVQERQSILRAVKVLRNIVHSASICAPPDLWILRHVVSTHVSTGVLQFFRSGKATTAEALAKRFGLNPLHLSWDLALLHTRGYLRCRKGRYRVAGIPQAEDVYANAAELPIDFVRDMVEPITFALSAKPADTDLIRRFLTLPQCQHRKEGWVASHQELEIGYRLVPLVLALHVLRAGKNVSQGTLLSELAPGVLPEVELLLQKAGMIDSNAALTALAVRVLDRGPGPFGIIHAYVPYMEVLKEKLMGAGAATQVQRGKNIAASQKANKKTFEMGNDCLDRFCRDYQFRFQVFIEHALGLGEATRQRLQRSGEESIRYVGADLEDAAIDRAVALQQRGELPKNMIFVRRADIAKPEILLDAMQQTGLASQGAVMIVGNGFHEIRGQTNERVIEIFHGYCKAGILVVFTEESALSDHDLLTSGWNTYHAGFRYVHELSGQGLRPASGTDGVGRHSWKICASLGGYAVLLKYSSHTRTIYPFPRKGGYNPPISMTYFCVPAEMAIGVGMYPTNWTAAVRPAP